MFLYRWELDGFRWIYFPAWNCLGRDHRREFATKNSLHKVRLRSLPDSDFGELDSIHEVLLGDDGWTEFEIGTLITVNWFESCQMSTVSVQRNLCMGCSHLQWFPFTEVGAITSVQGFCPTKAGVKDKCMEMRISFHRNWFREWTHSFRQNSLQRIPPSRPPSIRQSAINPITPV